MVGTSANLVEIHDFAIITSNKIGVLPRVTGTLVNNSNNRLITFRYTLKFYQCPILKYDRSNVNGCKEVRPEEISATNNMYELHIGVDPHSHAIFDEQMITYLGNLYSSYNRYDTYVTVRPVIYMYMNKMNSSEPILKWLQQV
jgi:hypothetical protein